MLKYLKDMEVGMRARIIEDDKVYPMGLTRTSEGFHICVESGSKYCYIILYNRNEEEAELIIEFPPEKRVGDIWSMSLAFDDIKRLDSMEYNFKDESSYFVDPYAKVCSGRDSWGKIEQIDNVRRAAIFNKDIAVEKKKDIIPWSDMIIYRMNVRGFTKENSSKSVHKGTFEAILDKVDYLKDLGINTIELMPCQEFEELMVSEFNKNDYKINYWGYADAFHFAPKAAYCKKKNRNPINEFKNLVNCLHLSGFNIIVEFYFKNTDNDRYIQDVIRYWVRKFNIDGVHLTGYYPLKLLAEDAYLADIKLLAGSWGDYAKKNRRNLAEYNHGFATDIRRALKSDENIIESLAYRIKENPSDRAVINYVADVRGFSLIDTFSYNEKHNEANGENNADGATNNYSWNCGVEGYTRKQSVLRLRKRLAKNALLTLFLSQGVPMIFSGDEVLKSREGNNNAYCQDNSISWFDWKILNKNKDIHTFVKKLIKFRKENNVFKKDKEYLMKDTFNIGIPDISYHGQELWKPVFSSDSRTLAVLYCEKKGVYYYVIYNMHWEEKEFGLPILEKALDWKIIIDTYREDISILDEGISVNKKKKMLIKPRSITVLKSFFSKSE